MEFFLVQNEVAAMVDITTDQFSELWIEHNMANKFVLFVKMSVMVLVMVLWTVIGFLFWIPLLSRVTAVYVVTIVDSTFTNRDLGGIGILLDKAIQFYSSGFRKIVDSVWAEDDGREISLDIDWRRIIIETTYSLVFWGSVVSLYLFLF